MKDPGKQRQVEKPPLNTSEIYQLICGLSGNHILKNSPQSYVVTSSQLSRASESRV
jgi:hypothetical protein